MRTTRFGVCLAMLLVFVFGGLAVKNVRAQQPEAPADRNGAAAQPSYPQRTFQPPPMPAFMLQRPDKPLSQEEMMRQADEAAAKARENPPPSGAQSSPGGVKKVTPQ